MGLRAIGIVRVSQRDDDTGHSPEVQVRAMLKQARDDGFALAPDDIWDENVDSAGKVRKVSGGAALADRPKLEAAVRAVENGEAQVILAERLDRLFRDLDVQREVIGRVEAAGGRLVTVAGQISHATAEAELQANLNGAVSQYTKRTAIERSRAAVQIAIDRGIAPHGRVTAGYRRRADGVLEPDPDVMPVVAEAFRMRAAHATVDAVWRHLRANGVTMTYGGAYALLRSRVVLGELHHGKYAPNLAAHEPIVDRDTWELVQGTRVPSGRKPQSDRLLARLGVLRCGTCDSRMAGSTARGARSAGGGGGMTYPVYRCGNRECPRQMSVMADLVDDAAAAVTRRILRAARGQASAAGEYRDAARDLDRSQAVLEKLIELLDPLEPASERRLASATADRDTARGRVEELRRRVELDEVDVDRWDALSVDERRDLVRRVLRRVRVLPGRGLGRLDFEPF